MSLKSYEGRFWERISPEPNSGCWIWLGGLGGGDYGAFRVGEKQFAAHRYSYELYKGAIPDGLVLDHLCRIRCCVNPAHLEAVPQKTNVERGLLPDMQRALRNTITHCKHGHEFTADNSLFDGRGRRRCKECSKVWGAASRNKLKSDPEAMSQSRKYQREYARRTRGKGGKLRILECETA